jgi:hypothetical protein
MRMMMNSRRDVQLSMESELKYYPHTVPEVREDKQKNSLDVAGFEH